MGTNTNHGGDRMKQGDIVKFKGFECYAPDNQTHYGIIIRVHHYGGIDVLWGIGTVGLSLFPQTIEIVSECW